jgi:hypothetical protein
VRGAFSLYELVGLTLSAVAAHALPSLARSVEAASRPPWLSRHSGAGGGWDRREPAQPGAAGSGRKRRRVPCKAAKHMREWHRM